MGVNEKVIHVYADWSNTSPTLMGKLYVDTVRGNELFSFEYEKNWLKTSKSSFIFDPDLCFYEGRQYVPLDKSLFGAFSDSCPDRWGRLLMKRKEAIEAKAEGRKPRTLKEIDFLLGVHDKTRIGALRFSLEENGLFLSADDNFSVPPWTKLRTLEAASINYENDKVEEEKWLKQLLAPGSSLGGARPKASVLAPDNSLWIAKFPSRNDEWNSGTWEIVTHNLAAKCGLRVPNTKLLTFSDNGGTFLVERFDRNKTQRIHFSSAMTLLGKTDGEGSEGTSYLDIASFIKSNGASPKGDLRELWKRIVFSIAVSNTDDHLRNHGFLLTPQGWVLSPLYDVNPNIYGDTLSLNINELDNTLSFDLALETVAFYEIDLEEAKSIITDMKKIISNNWQQIAINYGLSKSEIDRMEMVFI